MKYILYLIVIPAYSTEILVYQYFPGLCAKLGLFLPYQCWTQLHCTRALSIRAYEQGLDVATYALVMPLGPNNTELSSQLSKRMFNTLLNHLCTWLFRALQPYNWLQHCNCEETMIKWLEANTKTLPRNQISRWTVEEKTVFIQLWPPVDSP